MSGATLVVYAAKHGQTALDGEGEQLARLRSRSCSGIATPNVEINKLFRLVRDDVMEATAAARSPTLMARCRAARISSFWRSDGAQGEDVFLPSLRANGCASARPMTGSAKQSIARHNG